MVRGTNKIHIESVRELGSFSNAYNLNPYPNPGCYVCHFEMFVKVH
jgi:hypothetical protein